MALVNAEVSLLASSAVFICGFVNPQHGYLRSPSPGSSVSDAITGVAGEADGHSWWPELSNTAGTSPGVGDSAPASSERQERPTVLLRSCIARKDLVCSSRGSR